MRYVFVFIACLGQSQCRNSDASVSGNSSNVPKDSAFVVKELFRQDSLLSTYEGKGVFKLLTDNRYMKYKIFRRDSLPVKYDTSDLMPNESGLYEINVPLGSRYEITFVDGAKAYLNAGTTFRFKDNENMYAEISGEGYFRCKRQWVIYTGEHKFTIPSNSAINIRCYLSEKPKASMIAGTALIDKIPIPSASLVEFNSAPIIKLSHYEDDPEDPISWVNGILTWQNKSCHEGYSELMRWFTNVKISPGSNCFNGSRISCLTKLTDIIKLFELNNLKISFQIDSTCSIIIKK